MTYKWPSKVSNRFYAFGWCPWACRSSKCYLYPWRQANNKHFWRM